MAYTNGDTTKGAPPSTDSSAYSQHHQGFRSEGLPRTTVDWIVRAQAVAQILAADAALRNIEQYSPRAEVALLKSSGLTRLLGEKRHGGGGESWETAYKVIREVAKGDGSLGMLLGYHLLWSVTAVVVGDEQQADGVGRAICYGDDGEGYFVGGAVNPRDSDLSISQDAQGLIFTGFKNFNTGGVISDLTVLEGVLDGTDQHIFTLVKTRQPGIQFKYNWDAIGMRLTESGSVRIDNVRVPWSDALGWDGKTHQPKQDVLGVPFASMLLPTIQLVFSNFYLGIAQGALDAAQDYTRTNTRAWPYGGDDKTSATEEWYILERYGGFRAHLDAADALADRAGKAIADVYRDAGVGAGGSALEQSEHVNGHSHGTHVNNEGRAAITPETRGNVAARVATVKVVTTDTALEVTSGVFEMLGSRATARKAGFDRYWRDVRTHTLHDPVAYKRREVGRWTLLGEIPEPTWYT